MGVEELVWDMDGTLLDTTVVVPAAFVRTVRALGGPEVGADEVVEAYWRGTPEVILEHFVGRQLTAKEAEFYYRELEAARPVVYPGVREVFETLRSRGRARAVFTGASTRAASMLLRAAGLEADLVLGGDQVARPKPAPDGILLAAERLGAEAGRLAYVGDSPLDLRAARAAGSHSAAAGWGHMYDATEPAHSVLDRPQQALDLLAEHVPG
ncbi:HAD-IA family hydrolase [Streptomyces sp. SID11385]|uniref:HAD family hydrolase n=1 Tax=Streptomyces sp. SID11385 TaxID=2706031 RepID=UPI0013CD9352|nr:HAD-IA family hydrolase [Streptomyces sp. SID11385]NEA41261.1 HAD-IA family hydrolase [Streptomyces sp. SID11385]